MSKRFVLTLLCSALFIPFTLQTASATPSCDAETVAEVRKEIVRLRWEKSLLVSRTNRLLQVVYNRGEGAAEDLLEQLQRAEGALKSKGRLCMDRDPSACPTAERLEYYIETLHEAIGLLRFDITEAIDVLLTRSGNIEDGITSDLNRATAFMRECSSSDR